jgi:anti-anti-sigma factor
MTEPAVIAPVGELDLHSVRALTPQLDEAVAADYPQVILDLSAVTLVDSTALGAIMQAEHRFRGQGGRCRWWRRTGLPRRCSSN